MSQFSQMSMMIFVAAACLALGWAACSAYTRYQANTKGRTIARVLKDLKSLEAFKPDAVAVAKDAAGETAQFGEIQKEMAKLCSPSPT